MKKRNNIIYLDKKCKKDAYCDRNEYFKKYGLTTSLFGWTNTTFGQFSYNGDFKGMMKNTPIVINIGGTYYYVDKLVPLFGSSSIRFEKFDRELRDPRSSGKCTLLPPAFIWR